MCNMVSTTVYASQRLDVTWPITILLAICSLLLHGNHVCVCVCVASVCFVYCVSSEVYRLNLEQGRFLTPLTNRVRYVYICVLELCQSKINCSACTVCGFNSEHQLLTIGTEEV